ncbi:hypothetical protein NDA14_006114 [Ustilago hordei]|uniref:uncharacterized protein n=1 Tax=Ustilago hordei TaxID=120017 RepID=UPI001A405769|nr:uncharacterized protein UHO2_01296 [Ustilago hordei]KAJ1603374.1 hypothetical protein NDA14_006114 [Ustilago hordei]UTT94783.1 hypothetical protein NDA17_006860 [Ustilago hordei]SYW74430.1 uncharacterized protein UHO2_01296 [Ustilago hordei]
MPHPRTPKPNGASREGSGEESDATIDPATSIQTRRTRKRPAQMAREASVEQTCSLSPFRSHTCLEDSTADESSSSSSSSNVMQTARNNAQERRARSTRSNLELRLEANQPPSHHGLRSIASTLQPSSIPSRSSSSRTVNGFADDAANVNMPPSTNSSQLSERSVLSDVKQPLASLAGRDPAQGSSAADYTTSMTRTSSRTISNILGSGSSNTNILASNNNSRPNSMNGCMPLGRGFNPSYNPPSSMSMPRTPLAEIPLWLADMTLSLFSSGLSSCGATRNGSTSPVVPFRRSLRGGRPRQSNENGRISPSPSYFGKYDALPSPSSASIQGETGPLETTSNPDAGLTSSTIHLGTTSPATPSVHAQTSSPAMSTCSHTLNRAGSSQDLHTSFYTARSNLHQQGKAHDGEEPRSASLLERRAATAAAVGSGTAANAFVHVASCPSSRTSSPARVIQASRRRSTIAEGQDSMPMEETLFGPRPANLPPLQIPGARLATNAGLLLLDVPAPFSMMVRNAEGQQSINMEPVSPSAFSEMTSLTQGSTASKSMNSAAGMPAMPSSSTSTLDPYTQTMQQEPGALEAGANNIDSESVHSPRQGGQQRKNHGNTNADEEGLGIQFRPWPCADGAGK